MHALFIAKVIKFSQICMLLEANSKQAAILRVLPTYACLVQGCWVVKSELLYPDGSTSPTSGVEAEVLRNGRDYVLWKFTQTRFVIRKEISSVVKLPFDDLKDILEQVAQLRVSQGWEFMGEYDDDFVKRHSDIVARQQQLWDTRYKKLCDDLSISQTEKPVKGQAPKLHDMGRAKTVESGADSAKGQKPKAARKKTTTVSEKGQMPCPKPEEAIQSGHSQTKPGEADGMVIMTEAVEVSQPMDIGGMDDVPDSLQHTTSLAEIVSPMELEYAAQVEVTMTEDPSSCQSKMELTKDFSSSGASGSNAREPSASFQSPSRIPAASATLSAKSSEALAKFLRSCLGKGVLNFRDIRNALMLKQEECLETHPLNVAIPDVALEKSLNGIGAVEVEYKRKSGDLQNISSSRLFALKSTDEPTDKYRHVLLDMFREGTVWQKKQILQRIADALGQEPTQREVTKVLKDLCYCKSNKHWHLIGTD
jgi:DNA-directed RNA polymerase-3 subunit RPC5